MKKILIVSPSTGLGGAERQAILLSELLEGDNKISFLCFHSKRDKNQVPLAFSNSSVKVHVIKSFFPSSYLARLFRTIQLFLFLLTKHYDCILAYQYEMNVTIGLLDYILRFKKIIWNQRDEGLGVFKTKINQLAVRRYKKFIANSEGGANYLIKTFGVNSKQIVVIPNGVCIRIKTDRDSWRVKNNFDKTDVLACMVANIHSNKDHETLIRAWGILKDRDIHAKLLLVGFYGNTYEKVKSLILELGLDNSIFLPGHTEDVGSLLNAMDISVLSSPSEGLSNTMLESMAVGIPFVGSRIPAITDVLGGDYPYTFPLKDANTLASILEDIIKDPEKSKLWVSHNKKIIEDSYSIEKLKEKTINVLNS